MDAPGVPQYVPPGYQVALTSWPAIQVLFEIGEQTAGWLFSSSCYGDRYSPRIVADRIRDAVRGDKIKMGRHA